MPLDELNQSLRNRYFYGDWGRGIYNDSIFISTTAGKPLLTMWRWSMVPNASEATGSNAANQQSPDAGYRVSATFDSPTSEHYYGLGQQQQGFLDLRDH
jgi:alpha-glucosidase/alpha-D-xyloside xylohydrolase